MLTLVLHLDTIQKITAINKHYYKTEYKICYFCYCSKTYYCGISNYTCIKYGINNKLHKLPLYDQSKSVIHFNNTIWTSDMQFSQITNEQFSQITN